MFQGPKILIRQAGVGIVATLDDTNARCPQSVYVYRLTQAALNDGYTLEFVLAALVSRTMSYFVAHRFGEIDPAKAFAKMTHDRLSGLPIPNLISHDDLADAQAVAPMVRDVIGTQGHGTTVDHQIEQLLRRCWRLNPSAGAYINGKFNVFPDGQGLRDLFPGGPPSRQGYPAGGPGPTDRSARPMTDAQSRQPER